MAYSLSSSDGDRIKLDQDLKGSVDFDFFDSDTPPKSLSSNNNAVLHEEPCKSSNDNVKMSNAFDKSKSTDTHDQNCKNDKDIPSFGHQNGFSHHFSSNNQSPTKTADAAAFIRVDMPPLDITALTSNSPTDYSSDSSSHSSSLSRSQSLPHSGRTSSASNSLSDDHSSASPSRSVSPSSESERRPLSPSPTPRSLPSVSNSHSSSAASPEKCPSESSNRAFQSSPTGSKINNQASKSRSLSPHKREPTTTPTSSPSANEDYSDVTDVSPLSSANTSPIMSPSLARRTTSPDHSRPSTSCLATPPRHRGPDKASKDHGKADNQEQLSRYAAMLEDGDQDRINVHMIMRALLEMDQEQHQEANTGRHSRPPSRPGSALAQGVEGGQRNRSFSAERCHWIDVENRRLLSSLMSAKGVSKAHQNSPSPSVSGKLGGTASARGSGEAVGFKRPASSAINRQRQQRQIEAENQAILRRIRSIRPTRDLTRTEQLRQYDKLVRGGGVSPGSGKGRIAAVHQRKPKCNEGDSSSVMEDSSASPNWALRRTQSATSLIESAVAAGIIPEELASFAFSASPRTAVACHLSNPTSSGTSRPPPKPSTPVHKTPPRPSGAVSERTYAEVSQTGIKGPGLPRSASPQPGTPTRVRPSSAGAKRPQQQNVPHQQSGPQRKSPSSKSKQAWPTGW